MNMAENGFEVNNKLRLTYKFLNQTTCIKLIIIYTKAAYILLLKFFIRSFKRRRSDKTIADDEVLTNI